MVSFLKWLHRAAQGFLMLCFYYTLVLNDWNEIKFIFFIEKKTKLLVLFRGFKKKLLDPGGPGVRKVMFEDQEKWKNAQELILVGPVLKRGKINFLNLPQIAVDGGIHFSKNPITWLGDGDSTRNDFSKESLILKVNQNESDLRFALTEIAKIQWKVLHLFGFYGGRKDHELANWGEIYQELKLSSHREKVVFYDEYENPKVCILNSITTNLCHRLQVNGVFSVFSFEPTELNLRGDCQFKVNQFVLNPFTSQGLSNFGNGAIEVQNNAPLLFLLGG